MTDGAIVIGVSAGGLNALNYVFSALPADFTTPIITVQHTSSRSSGDWITLLNNRSRLEISEAQEKEPIQAGHVYIAPANYHLLIEKDKTFTLTIDEKVNFARPSIDVLFESAADAYGNNLTGIILTGANHDGASGLYAVHLRGGCTIIQDPATAVSPAMPLSVLKIFQPDHILPLEEITALLIQKESILKDR
jgi:two-component system chemotaxis response regulator CheB